MPKPHPRPYRSGSEFGPGPRRPLTRNERSIWRFRLDLARRARLITALHVLIGEALLRRLGIDGQCDPKHETLASDVGCDVGAVKRALEAFREIGVVQWTRRLVMDGWRAVQTSNAYALMVPDRPGFACEVRRKRETRKGFLIPSFLRPRGWNAQPPARSVAEQLAFLAGLEAAKMA
jgi:hypothetical protein